MSTNATKSEPKKRRRKHKVASREEWIAARKKLLEAEKNLTRRSDKVVRQRQKLPWVWIDKEYRFETEEGNASLADLFRGRSQLLIYHFMFGPITRRDVRPARRSPTDSTDSSRTWPITT